MAAMAALQAPTMAASQAVSHTSSPALPGAASSSSSPSLFAIARVRCFNSGLRAENLGHSWRAPLVAVRAQVEKSSVQERSVDEKDRDLVASKGFQDQLVEEAEEEEVEDYGVDAADDAAFNAAGGEEDYGEVNKILASRVVDGETQYLIEWKDDHPESWEPPANIARFVLAFSLGMSLK